MEATRRGFLAALFAAPFAPKALAALPSPTWVSTVPVALKSAGNVLVTPTWVTAEVAKYFVQNQAWSAPLGGDYGSGGGSNAGVRGRTCLG